MNKIVKEMHDSIMATAQKCERLETKVNRLLVLLQCHLAQPSSSNKKNEQTETQLDKQLSNSLRVSK